MTQSAVVSTRNPDSTQAGLELGRAIASVFAADAPDAVILFASPRHDHGALLQSLTEAARPGVLVGASSAGEFTTDVQGDGLTCALALKSSDMFFSVGVGHGVGGDRAAAAKEIVGAFQGPAGRSHLYRSALVLADALAGHVDDLVEDLTLETAGTYQFFGGGAGDDAQFRRTHVFHGTEVLSDAAVALEILSVKPLGIGASHGWETAGPPLRVTEADGLTVRSLNGMPAAQVFEDHARATGQTFDQAAPIPFFLHNILGIDTGDGFRLRVPLVVNADGSVTCAADIDEGAVVRIMRTTNGSAVDAAERATKAALGALGDHRPQVALVFDCVATRLRMGEGFGLELNSISNLLGDASFVGCNTHGQIVRAQGQFGGFHNCNAVVCVFPE